MSKLKGKKILIFQQRGWAINVGHFLAQKLQEEGVVLGALTAKATTHEFITKQKEIKYEYIISSDEVKSRPDLYLNGEQYSMEKICADLGILSIWPLVAGARNHVRSYKDKYYYGFKQNVSDENIILYVQAVYKCIKDVFDKFGPELIITPNFPTLHHLMFYYYAHKRGVPMIALTDSKVRGVYIFSHDYNYSTGSFHNRVKDLNEKIAYSENLDKARKYIKEFRKNFKAPEGAEFFNPGNKKRPWKEKLRSALSPYYHSLKWYTNKSKNHWESIGVTIDYRPPSIILRDHYAYKRYRKFANNFKYYPLEKIKKYAYLPLQVQPEEAIDVYSPFFSNQIETARQIAMSLPDDYTLVVREHPAMVGLRSPSYLEKIDRTPNVKLVDYRIPSETVIKGCDIVICQNGTTVAEASLLGKPVIQLGNLGTTLILPGVKKHTDMTTLSKEIVLSLSEKPDSLEHERRLENFVAAAYDTGLEENYIGIWERGKNKDKRNSLWLFYQKEIESCLNL